jgi:hypothetical protein
MIDDNKVLTYMRGGALARGWFFDTAKTESALIAALFRLSEFMLCHAEFGRRSRHLKQR